MKKAIVTTLLFIMHVPLCFSMKNVEGVGSLNTDNQKKTTSEKIKQRNRYRKRRPAINKVQFPEKSPDIIFSSELPVFSTPTAHAYSQANEKSPRAILSTLLVESPDILLPSADIVGHRALAQTQSKSSNSEATISQKVLSKKQLKRKKYFQDKKKRRKIMIARAKNHDCSLHEKATPFIIAQAPNMPKSIEEHPLVAAVFDKNISEVKKILAAQRVKGICVEEFDAIKDQKSGLSLIEIAKGIDTIQNLLKSSRSLLKRPIFSTHENSSDLIEPLIDPYEHPLTKAIRENNFQEVSTTLRSMRYCQATIQEFDNIIDPYYGYNLKEWIDEITDPYLKQILISARPK